MFDRKLDATRWEADELARLNTGTWIDPRAGQVTFRDFAIEWLALQPLRPTSRARYEQLLRLNILPLLGDLPLSAIRRSHVQAMVASVADRLSPSAARGCLIVTGAVFKAAVLDRRLAVSPCTAIKLPHVEERRVCVITTEQVLALEAAAPPAWRAVVALGAGAGLRQGEALGVTRDRIDFLRRTLRVDRQLLNLPYQPPALVPVKTSSSVRTLPLPQVVLEALSTHFAAGHGPHGDAEFVFPPVTRQYFSKYWRVTARGAGLPDSVTYHSLRHYYASLLIRHGESIKTVQERLGHSSAVTTLNIYSHLWPDSDDRTRAAVDDVLGAAVHSVCTAATDEA
jgi:integrase